MSRSTRFLTALAALAALATAPATAQQVSKTVSWALTTTITPSLVCTKVTDLPFGTHLSTDGTISSSATNFAKLSCTTDPGNTINVSMVAPLNLTSGANTIPLTYGTTAASLVVGGNDNAFAVSASQQMVISQGTFDVTLGAGTGSRAVSFSTIGAKIGTYSATVVVTIAVP